MRVVCISKKERLMACWSKGFKLGRVYRVLDEKTFQVIGRYNDVPTAFYVDRECFIDMKLIWGAIAFFFVLFLAMVGESLVDYILSFL
jgi:hypothetical protein